MQSKHLKQLLVVVLVLGGTRLAVAAPADLLDDLGPVEYEVKSEYSHIRVRQKGDVRTIVFVRDGGQEIGETKIDISKPHELLIPYTQTMFASFLVRPKQEKVLIVGLGGGAMVQFLKHHEPEVKVDAVEIDPAVVKIAAEYFDTKPSDNVRIFTQDGFEYFKATEDTYDVIYMDAFLKPSRGTDSTGVPLNLKTVEFYKSVQSKLNADGLVVFNLNPSRTIRNDIATIRKAFPVTYNFRVAQSQNLVVVASISKRRMRNAELVPVARELDDRFEASFSFQRMLRLLTR
jgi:spermidine synthase